MSEGTITDLRAAQGPVTPAGTDLVYTSQGIYTLDEISVLLSGSTIAQKRTDSFSGALLWRNNNASGQAPGIIDWVAAVYDTDSFWSGAQPSRMVIPANVVSIVITGQVSGGGAVTILKNGVSEPGLPTNQPAGNCFTSARIPVTTGDYIEVTQPNAEVSSSFLTWIAIEAVELTP